MSLTPSFPILLQTGRREIRVTRGKRLNFLSRLLGAGALKFARALQQRYTDRGWRDPLHGFILRKHRIGAAIQHLHRRQQISITPHLNLTVLNWTMPAGNVEHSAPVPSLPHLRHQRETQLVITVAQQRETHLLEQVAEQIISHKRRVEIKSQPPFASPSLPQAPEIKRVVRQALSTKTDQVPLPTDVERRIDRKQLERKTGNEMDRVRDVPIDINRLTDQIIQTIDRRIIAQRERLGRV
jgi:hypothetical protein